MDFFTFLNFERRVLAGADRLVSHIHLAIQILAKEIGRDDRAFETIKDPLGPLKVENNVFRPDGDQDGALRRDGIL